LIIPIAAGLKLKSNQKFFLFLDLVPWRQLKLEDEYDIIVVLFVNKSLVFFICCHKLLDVGIRRISDRHARCNVLLTSIDLELTFGQLYVL